MYKFLYGILGFMIVFIIISSIINLKIRLLDNNIKKINTQIEYNYKTLQSLKAEWNYLNNPEYLKLMSNKYLKDMRSNYTIDNDRVMRIPLKPES